MTKRTCTVDGCDKPHLARGYCSSHYRKIANPDAPRDRRVELTCIDCGETVRKMIDNRGDADRCIPCARKHGAISTGALLHQQAVARRLAAPPNRHLRARRVAMPDLRQADAALCEMAAPHVGDPRPHPSGIARRLAHKSERPVRMLEVQQR